MSRLIYYRANCSMRMPHYVVRCKSFSTAGNTLTESIEMWNQKKTQVDDYAGVQIEAIEYYEGGKLINGLTDQKLGRTNG